MNVDIKSSARIYSFCATTDASDDEAPRRRQRAGPGVAQVKRRRDRRRRALSNIECRPHREGLGRTEPAAGAAGGMYKNIVEVDGPFYKVSWDVIFRVFVFLLVFFYAYWKCVMDGKKYR